MYDFRYNGKFYTGDPMEFAPVEEGHENYGVRLYTFWNIPEEDAINISNENKWNQIREHRDKLLSDTDWWAMSDRTMSQAQIDYRQALRDITTQSDPNDITWPTKPE